jgi:hypothetical protein
MTIDVDARVTTVEAGVAERITRVESRLDARIDRLERHTDDRIDRLMFGFAGLLIGSFLTSCFLVVLAVALQD